MPIRDVHPIHQQDPRHHSNLPEMTSNFGNKTVRLVGVKRLEGGVRWLESLGKLTFEVKPKLKGKQVGTLCRVLPTFSACHLQSNVRLLLVTTA